MQYSYVHDKSEEIAIKYDYKLPIIPYSTTTKLLKNVFQLAGINSEYNKYTDYGGVTVEKETKYKWELIGTHTARRSFVTQGTLDDYNKDILKGASGHTTDVAFNRYNVAGSERSVVAYAKAVIKRNIPDSNTQSNPVDGSIVTINKELIEEAKNVLLFLGCDGITVADITSIDEANRLIYSQYERELTDLGIDYHIIKDLYNDNSKATLRDKRNALLEIVKAIKRK